MGAQEFATDPGDGQQRIDRIGNPANPEKLQKGLPRVRDEQNLPGQQIEDQENQAEQADGENTPTHHEQSVGDLRRPIPDVQRGEQRQAREAADDERAFHAVPSRCACLHFR